MKGIRLTDKGEAFLAAIDAGLVPETDDGYDDAVFQDFWEKYSMRMQLKEFRGNWLAFKISLSACLFSAVSALVAVIGCTWR